MFAHRFKFVVPAVGVALAGAAAVPVAWCTTAARHTQPLGRRACSAASPKALDPVEAAKRVAARKAVDEYVRSGQNVGVGSGSTITYAVERLAELTHAPGSDFSVTCVPTSFQAEQLIVEHGLKLSNLSITPELDVAIDGADEVDGELNCIKGGGGCQAQEKVVASCAKEFVVIADYRKQARHLGTAWKKGVPIEVLPFAYKPLLAKIRALGGEPTLRMATAKAGPVVTDNGNFIIDAEFGTIHNPGKLNTQLLHLPGVVETGLFVGMAKHAYFGQKDGSVQEWRARS